jgi:hypothetical protein
VGADQVTSICDSEVDDPFAGADIAEGLVRIVAPMVFAEESILHPSEFYAYAFTATKVPYVRE